MSSLDSRLSVGLDSKTMLAVKIYNYGQFAPFCLNHTNSFFCLFFNLGSPHLYLSIVVSLFVHFSVFSPHSVCVCLCLHSLLGPTFECNLFSLRSASLLVQTGKVWRISRHSPVLLFRVRGCLWCYIKGEAMHLSLWRKTKVPSNSIRGPCIPTHSTSHLPLPYHARVSRVRMVFFSTKPSWEFRPRKKISSPPPPGRSPTRPHPWDFQ